MFERMLKKVFILFFVAVVAISVWLVLWIYSIPDIEDLNKHDTGLFIKIKEVRGGVKEWPVGTRNPWWVSLNRVSPYLIDAVIASEDDAFFEHDGFDFDEIKDAIKTDIKKKKLARGASTITMQLARNLYLTKEKTLTRKLKEAYITYRVERILTKSRILELYLNIVEWGPGIYGIGEASEYYFGKSPSELNLKEATLLAVILPNPRFYNPYVRVEKVEKRQNYLLTRMLMEHDIQEIDYELAVTTTIELKEKL